MEWSAALATVFYQSLTDKQKDLIRAQVMGDSTLVATAAHKPKKQPEESKQSSQSGSSRWTEADHLKFIEGLRKHGKNWKAMLEHFDGEKTYKQLASHAQWFRNKCKKDPNTPHSDVCFNILE